jgi:hypothetical protein
MSRYDPYVCFFLTFETFLSPDVQTKIYLGKSSSQRSPHRTLPCEIMHGLEKVYNRF